MISAAITLAASTRPRTGISVDGFSAVAGSTRW